MKLNNLIKAVLAVSVVMVVWSFDTIRKDHSTSNDINWISIDEAVELAEKDGKKILVDVYTDWCGWCKKMDQSTYKDSRNVTYINENFHAVKFDAEQKESITIGDKTYKFVAKGRRGYHELAVELLKGRLSYPTTSFLNSDFSPLYNVPGYIDAEKMNTILSFTNEEAYKTQDFQAYEAARAK